MSDPLHQAPPEQTEAHGGPAWLHLLLPLVVLACGVAIAAWLLQTGPKAKPRAKARNAVAVDVRPVEFAAQATTVEVMGTVVPQREVVLKPQVGGRILAVSDKLMPGGRFTKGETLLTIDPRDYRLAVQQLESELARVDADLQIELGRQRVARREFELLGEKVSAEEQALMLREPQLANLRAVRAATEARLERARLDLERTLVTAPFNAVVVSREVAAGASVTAATTLATLAGSDGFWIEAPVPAGQLHWIDTGSAARADGSPARIFDAAAGGEGGHRTGRVTGLTARVEEQGRMARLLVDVPDPLALQPATQGAPLLLGSYVRVAIDGTGLPRAAAVERDLVRDGDRLWIMTADDTLDIRPVQIAFRGRDTVLVTGGIEPGERLVTTNLPAPVQGLQLRLRDTGGRGAAEGAARP